MARKSLRDEVIQANVINLSWTTISRALKSKKINAKEKRVIALEIVKKSVPQKISGNLSFSFADMVRIANGND